MVRFQEQVGAECRFSTWPTKFFQNFRSTTRPPHHGNLHHCIFNSRSRVEEDSEKQSPRRGGPAKGGGLALRLLRVEESWEGKIRIIGKCHPIARNRLFLHDYWNYPTCDIWTVRPPAVQAAAQDMARANYASLEKWGIRNGVFTDLHGEDIPAALFSYYVGDIEPFKEFMSAAAASGNYLLFATR